MYILFATKCREKSEEKNMGYGLLKIIGNGTIRKLKYGLLFAFHGDISYIVLEIPYLLSYFSSFHRSMILIRGVHGSDNHVTGHWCTVRYNTMQQRRRQREGQGGCPRRKFCPPQPRSIKLYCKKRRRRSEDGTSHNSRERLCNNNRGPHSYLHTFPEFGN